MATEAAVGINSYVTRAEADAYLEDSARASNWLSVGTDDKNRALISATRQFEQLLWEGDQATLDIIDTVTINAAGTGYSINDVLTLVGGTGLVARFTVLTLSGSTVATVRILDAGLYSVQPGGTADTTTASPAGGTGCTLDTTYKTQTLQWARTGVEDQYDNAVTAIDYPTALKNGLMEYAFDVTQDAELLTSAGTGDNVKIAEAGSAKVQFFRPSGGPDGVGSLQPFAPQIMQWIGPLLAGSSLSAPSTFGTDVESQFDDCDQNGLNQGFA